MWNSYIHSSEQSIFIGINRNQLMPWKIWALFFCSTVVLEAYYSTTVLYQEQHG